MRNVALRQKEGGQVVVFFAILVPVFLMLTAVVVAGGNWFAHAKHLQTKADAAALAGGDTWAFPCGPGSDTNVEETGILDVARYYLGAHTTPTGLVTSSPLNPQIGGVPASDIHAVLNGNAYWDDDAGSNPADGTSPPGPAGSPAPVCEAKVLDVKATEANSFPLASVLPLFPDLKRKARLQIEEAEGVTGLLPIAVRIPRPLSAVAVFYNEANGTIISKQRMREVCIPSVVYCVPFAPAGLGQWTTDPVSGALPGVQVETITGVVIANSFRPSCWTPGATAPCLNDNPSGAAGTNITAFCNQNPTVTCWDATGGAGSQTVESGAQFIRGYSTASPGTGPPSIQTAYLRPSGCEPYVNSVPTPCSQILNVEVNLGALRSLYPDPPGPPPGPLTNLPLRAEDVEVRYRLARADGTSSCDFGSNCELLATSASASGVVTFRTTGASNSPLLSVPPDSWGNAVAIQIRLRQVELPNGLPANCANTNYNNNCRWYYTANPGFSPSPSVEPTDAQILDWPIQRSFMGSIDRTGPLRWLRLDIDPNCDTNQTGRLYGWDSATSADAASQPVGSSPCYVVNLGLQGGMARDQDEPPIGLLLGSGPSQRALVDCDPDVAHGQVADEIRDGCQWPPYRGNAFDDPPGPSGWCPYGDDTPGTFFDVPKPAPFDDWIQAFDCVLTRTTGSASQLTNGFDARLFNDTTNPVCPTDDGSEFQPGRNYWHRANNSNQKHGFAWDGTPARAPYAARGTKFHDNDKRLVNLFLTPYGSFTSTGNQVQALVGLGSFYITGYGHFTGGGLVIDDPCADGSGFPDYPYAGNDPPPDLTGRPGDRVIWGHFVKDVADATGGTGVLCQPELSFNPCTPVLVE